MRAHVLEQGDIIQQIKHITAYSSNRIYNQVQQFCTSLTCNATISLENDLNDSKSFASLMIKHEATSKYQILICCRLVINELPFF